MTKQRGWPDRRGMGSESDSISEQFVPSERHKTQQKEMAEILLAAGFTPQQIATMFPVRLEPPLTEKPNDR
jgi:hypothetical protein